MLTPTERFRSIKPQVFGALAPEAFHDLHFDVVVIGGGASGCATAMYAAEGGLQVALLESGSDGLGGASVHEHLLPVRRALLQYCDFRSTVTACTNETIARDTFNLLAQSLNVTIISAVGWLGNENEVVMKNPITGMTVGILKAKNIVIATGTQVHDSEIFHGINNDYIKTPAAVFSSETIWTPPPNSYLILGNNTTAVECALALSSRGHIVTLATTDRCLLPDVPHAVRAMAEDALVELDIRLLQNVIAVEQTEQTDTGISVNIAQRDGREHFVQTSCLIRLDKRHAASENLGVRKHGIKIIPDDKRIQTDTFLRTDAHRVYAVGSVTNPTILPETSHAMGLALGSALAGNTSHSGTTGPESELHTLWLHQQLSWTGLTLTAALASGHDRVAQGIASMSQWTGIPMRKGNLAVIVDTNSFQILGGWATGPNSESFMRTIQMARAMEIPAFILAESGPWDPTIVTAVRHAIKQTN